MYYVCLFGTTWEGVFNLPISKAFWHSMIFLVNLFSSVIFFGRYVVENSNNHETRHGHVTHLGVSCLKKRLLGVP